MPQIIGIGGAVFDLLMHVEKFPEPDRGCPLTCSWQYGGKVPTGVCASTRLGASAAIVTVLGGGMGKACEQDFIRHGVDVSHIAWDPNGETGMCVAFTQDAVPGRNIMCYNPARLRNIQMEDLDKDFITSGELLFISQGDEPSITAARWAKEAGMKVIIDADGYHPLIAENMHLIDYFIASELYWDACFDHRDWEKGLSQWREKGPQVCIVTLGEKGLAGMDADGFFELPAFKVNAVDTTGAGDSFHGAFAYAMVENMPVREAARFSSAVSAIKCTSMGGRAGLPTRAMVERFIENGGVLDAADRAALDERVAYYGRLHMGY